MPKKDREKILIERLCKLSKQFELMAKTHDSMMKNDAVKVADASGSKLKTEDALHDRTSFATNRALSRTYKQCAEWLSKELMEHQMKIDK